MRSITLVDSESDGKRYGEDRAAAYRQPLRSPTLHCFRRDVLDWKLILPDLMVSPRPPVIAIFPHLTLARGCTPFNPPHYANRNRTFNKLLSEFIHFQCIVTGFGYYDVSVADMYEVILWLATRRQCFRCGTFVSISVWPVRKGRGSFSRRRRRVRWGNPGSTSPLAQLAR